MAKLCQLQEEDAETQLYAVTVTGLKTLFAFYTPDLC